MDAISAMLTRRSIRRYRPDPVPRELIEKIIDCARYAPTGRGEQPWEFVVVTEANRRKAIAELTDYGKFIAEAGCCIAVFCRETKYYLEDGSAATQNILLAATALGLGSCWVAGDKKPYVGDIASLLGTPPGLKLVSLVAIGYPDEQPVKQKRPLDEVLHWEKY